MKSRQIIKAITGALLLIISVSSSLFGQGITVPDYSYGSAYGTSATVTSEGVTNPGPYGNYSLGEIERPFGIFLGHGYRWWGYPTAPMLICGDFPKLDFPGFHGIYSLTPLGCANPPIGFMASFGCVIAETETRQIWGLAGAANQNGPTAQYCIPNPFGGGQICYPVPSTWGYGYSYGYLRKVVVVTSTGSLQPGDPVDISASLLTEGTNDTDWDASTTGVLFLNHLSENQWFGGMIWNDYLRWGDVLDILGTPEMMNSMLGNLVIPLNSADDTTATVAVGDTIMVEVAFMNMVQHSNPGESPTESDDGWAGEKPLILFQSLNFGRTDSIKKLVKRYGNRMEYDLVCLTSGAVLEPLNPDGPNLDEDKDGISDTREKGADGSDENFDGNSDGTPDWEQANVASFLTYDAQNYITMVVPEGLDLSQLIVTGNPSPLDAPVNTSFPFGFFDFSIDGLELGESIKVTIIMHGGETVDTYYKYGITPTDLIPHWYEFMYDGETGAEVHGNVITLHFVDGLRGDDDITENGSIKEPGGPSKSIITELQSLDARGEIKIYPNPASSHFLIEVPDAFVLPAELIFYNAAGMQSGRQIMTDRRMLINTNSAEWKPGVYYVRLRNGVLQAGAKVLIVR